MSCLVPGEDSLRLNATVPVRQHLTEHLPPGRLLRARYAYVLPGQFSTAVYQARSKIASPRATMSTAGNRTPGLPNP